MTDQAKRAACELEQVGWRWRSRNLLFGSTGEWRLSDAEVTSLGPGRGLGSVYVIDCEPVYVMTRSGSTPKEAGRCEHPNGSADLLLAGDAVEACVDCGALGSWPRFDGAPADCGCPETVCLGPLDDPSWCGRRPADRTTLPTEQASLPGRRAERCPTCDSLVGQRMPIPLAQCPDSWHETASLSDRAPRPTGHFGTIPVIPEDPSTFDSQPSEGDGR